MMLSAPPPRSGSRSRLVPGLSLRAGDLLAGRFRVEALCGGAGRVLHSRAHVHLAGIELATRAPVDIEILIAEGDAIESARGRFLAAARASAALESAHLARVLEAGVTMDGLPYVVRQALPAATLALLLDDRGALPTAYAVDVALDVADALAVAHARGILHGDLSPRSVHLVWSDEGPRDVVLADLGTAEVVGSLALDLRSLESLTMRAPERLVVSGRVDARVDVWGLGALLFTMLAGAPPFAADTPSALGLALANDEPASLAGEPDELAELVDACIARDPAKRPASVLAVAKALAPFASRPDEALARVRAHVPRPVLALDPLIDAEEEEEIEVEPEPDDGAVESVPTLVVDKEEYEALASEARAPAPAAASSSEVVVEVAPSVREVAPSAREVATAPMSMPPRPVEPRETPTVITRRPRARAGFGLAAVTLVAGIAIGARLFGGAPAPAAAPSPLATTAVAATPRAPSPAPSPSPASTSAEAVTPVTALPAAAAEETHAAPAKREPRAKARAQAKPERPAEPVAKAAAPAVPAPDPLIAAAAAPPADPSLKAAPETQPKPKASDDDLRRFLDDRR